MAVLSTSELEDLRRKVFNQLTTAGTAVNFTKAQANLALQAIEDWFEANRAAISTAINTATNPFVFSAAQKKVLGAYWLLLKYAKELA